MFLRKNARRKGAGVVLGKNGNARLGKDRTGVELRCHEVNRAAVFRKSLGERALVGIEAAQIWQERGMNVEHPSSPSLDEGGTQYAHEPGEAYNFN